MIAIKSISNINSNTTKTILLVLILFLGAFLRFYKLDYQSLWNDELSSWRRSNYETLSDVYEYGLKMDPHPPLYQVILYFMIKYAGDTEFLLRMPSVLFGILSIFMIFKLGSLIYSYREGITSALFMTLFWCPIYYSQEARAYSLLLLLAISTSYFAFKIRYSISKKNPFSLNDKIFFAALSVMMIYTHYFGVVLLLFQTAALLIWSIFQRSGTKSLLLIYSIIILAYLPWVSTIMQQYGASNKQ